LLAFAFSPHRPVLQLPIEPAVHDGLGEVVGQDARLAREVGMEAKRRGRAHKLYNGKTWEGALGFVVASMAMLVAIDILHIWWPLFHQFGWRIVAVELLAVLAGALVEVFAKRYDIIWIPLASASVVWVLL